MWTRKSQTQVACPAHTGLAHPRSRNLAGMVVVNRHVFSNGRRKMVAIAVSACWWTRRCKATATISPSTKAAANTKIDSNKNSDAYQEDCRRNQTCSIESRDGKHCYSNALDRKTEVPQSNTREGGRRFNYEKKTYGAPITFSNIANCGFS